MKKKTDFELIWESFTTNNQSNNPDQTLMSQAEFLKGLMGYINNAPANIASDDFLNRAIFGGVLQKLQAVVKDWSTNWLSEGTDENTMRELVRSILQQNMNSK